MGFSRQEYWSGLPADHKTKSHRSEVSSYLILCNNELFLDQIVTCDKKWILHNNWQWPAQWLNWEAPKHFPKPSLHQKNSNGHCLVIWSTTAFQIPAKPLHLRSMRSKSMKCTENCNACRQHWSIGCAQFFHVSHNQCFKRWMNWATKFCLILSSDLSATDYFFFKQLNFLQGKCFHNQQDTENAFQVFVKFWSTDFYTMK